VLVTEENKQMRKMKQLLAPQKNTDLITTCNISFGGWKREKMYIMWRGDRHEVRELKSHFL